MMNIGVDCIFAANGTVRVQRVEMGERWQAVEQGRQWVDENGRHVLILLPGNLSRELLFSGKTLSWHMLPGRNHKQVVA